MFVLLVFRFGGPQALNPIAPQTAPRLMLVTGQPVLEDIAGWFGLVPSISRSVVQSVGGSLGRSFGGAKVYKEIIIRIPKR